MNEEKIRLEAKEIMDNFMKSLSNIEIEEEFNLIRKNKFRNELDLNSEDNKNGNNEFKNNFLSNAPRTSGEAILANKGDWVSKTN